MTTSSSVKRLNTDTDAWLNAKQERRSFFVRGLDGPQQIKDHGRVENDDAASPAERDSRSQSARHSCNTSSAGSRSPNTPSSSRWAAVAMTCRGLFVRRRATVSTRARCPVLLQCNGASTNDAVTCTFDTIDLLGPLLRTGKARSWFCGRLPTPAPSKRRHRPARLTQGAVITSRLTPRAGQYGARHSRDRTPANPADLLRR